MCVFALRKALRAVWVMHLQEHWVRLDQYMSRVMTEGCTKEPEQQQTVVRRVILSIDVSIMMTAPISLLRGLRHSESATITMLSEVLNLTRSIYRPSYYHKNLGCLKE